MLRRWGIWLSTTVGVALGSFGVWFGCTFDFDLWTQRSTKTTTYVNVAVGVIDTKRLREEILIYQQFREILEKSHRESHAEALKYETELREEYDHLAKIEEQGKSQALSKDVIEKKEAFERNYQSVQQKIVNTKEKLDQKFTSISEKIEKMIQEKIQVIVLEKKIDLLINSHGQDFAIVLHANKNIDITTEVIEKINKKVPTLKDLG